MNKGGCGLPLNINQLTYFFQVLAFFNAKDEQTRKVFFDELLDSIEEVGKLFF